jgi:methylthioribose-1-phosphate isomerase
MLYRNEKFTSLWENKSKPYPQINIIDQTLLPFVFSIIKLDSSDKAIESIKNMNLRGAPLIGVAGAYAVYFAVLESKSHKDERILREKIKEISEARPTAVNLEWAVNKTFDYSQTFSGIDAQINAALECSRAIRQDEINNSLNIGLNGVEFIEDIYSRTCKPVNILTHCNAGWLATIDYGTALAPIYVAQERNIPVRLWIDETRPRNQGSKLTAWEAYHQKLDYKLISDNAGGQLMRDGKIDMVIVGADRIASNGDVANKVGTYLKALAAKDNDIPFYVAAPKSTFDFNIESGNDIIIETRSDSEIFYIDAFINGEYSKVPIALENSPTENIGFDVTPSRLVSNIITEYGNIYPNAQDITKLLK